MPDFALEADLIARGTPLVCGVDEVGRGPLAGPVTAAAVVLDPGCIPEGLDDSKVLDRATRTRLAAALAECAQIAVVHVSVAEIDRINIYHAAHLAMCRAVEALPRRPLHALIDGNRVPEGLVCDGTPVVKGDGACLSIAAASIVAKAARDALMVELAQHHPGYGWETNAGYATQMHLSALRNLGPTPEHRRSFAPVRDILWQEKSASA
jgi:ribonuclease HII